MQIVINNISNTIVDGEIEGDTISCITLQTINENGESIYFTARYSDPYCGKKAKNILEYLNSEEIKEQIKNCILSLKNN